MFDKLEAVAQRYDELTQLMAQPEVATNVTLLQQYAREQRELEDIVTTYREYQVAQRAIAEAEAMLDENDPELRALAQEELDTQRKRLATLEEQLKVLLLPRDPNDSKDVIMEIRQGEGGDEAALFAADLFRMYTRFAESRGWKVEVDSLTENGIGGIKEVIFQIHGEGAYSQLKYEGGVHRVQRVPATEARGRIHTSTA
ncbi:MAG: peptide chain release factor 1, partial [Chloroflexus aggregans]